MQLINNRSTNSNEICKLTSSKALGILQNIILVFLAVSILSAYYSPPTVYNASTRTIDDATALTAFMQLGHLIWHHYF